MNGRIVVVGVVMGFVMGVVSSAWGQSGIRCRHRDYLGSFETPGSVERMLVEGETGYLPWGYNQLAIVDLADPLVPVVLSQVGMPGEIRELDLESDLLYAATRGGLVILDVSDPASPVELGVFAGEVFGVTAQGDRAYVKLYPGQLTLIDASDPMHPVELFAWDPPESINAAVWVGEYVYGARLYGGIDIFDVSVWWDPRRVGSLDTDHAGYSLWTDGTLVYLPAGYLDIFDASAPAAPTLLSSTYASASRIVVREGRVFSASSARLELWDVGDPAAPMLLGEWYRPRSRGGFRGLGLVGDIALGGRYPSGVDQVDVSHPKRPPRSATLGEDRTVADLALAGRLLAVSLGTGGIHFIDLTDPWNPVELGSVDTPGLAHDIAWSGSLLLVAEGPAGLVVIDASNPAQPALVGAYSGGERVVTVGAGAGVAFLGHQMGTQIEVVDVSDPSDPVPLGGFSSLSRPQQMEVRDGLLFMAEGPVGLAIYDITDPAEPTRLGLVATPGSVQGIWLDGDRAYLDAGAWGFHIVDISDPRAPELLGSVETDEQVYAAAGTHEYAVAVGLSGMLEVFDVTEPSAPTPAGEYYSGRSTAVAVIGDTIVAAGGDHTLLIVDAVDCPPCAADFNDDGSVDTRDVLAFLNAWASGDASADFNSDGTVNSLDVLAFLGAWAAGC
jgi:hypothetical protein